MRRPSRESVTHLTTLLDQFAAFIDSFVRSKLWWHASIGAALGTIFMLAQEMAPGVGHVSPLALREWLAMILPPPDKAECDVDVRATLGLVERAASFVSATAFLSFFVQMDGLVSSRGIAPAADVIRRRKRAVDWENATWAARRAAFHRLPNAFWFLGASDAALHGVCATGLGVSLALTCVGGAWASSGFGSTLGSLAWALTYACHLSLIAVSGDFLGLQSDSNLCEISIVFATLALVRTSAHEVESAVAALGVLRWLAARKMLGCGLCKYHGSSMWRAGTAMEVHYWTQPLPNPLSAWAHHLPRVTHRLAVLGTLAVELVLPTLSYARLWPARLFAFVGFVGLNCAINLTGNYGFIGALSIVESLSLLDDEMLPSAMRYGTHAGQTSAAVDGGAVAMAAAFIAYVIRALALLLLCAYILASLPPLSQASRHTVDAPLFLMSPAEYCYEKGRRYRAVNYYAKFASMHSFRWELVLEGSDDGMSWMRYGWRFKPWASDVGPRWLPFHLPRLDWRIWFLPLGCQRQGRDYTPPPWLPALLKGLARHEPAVLRLLDPTANPFASAPPRHGVRTRLEAFSFPPASGGLPARGQHDAQSPAWETTALPPVGRQWDTTSLCLEARAC